MGIYGIIFIYELKISPNTGHDSSIANSAYQRVILFQNGCDYAKRYMIKVMTFYYCQSTQLNKKRCDIFIHIYIYVKDAIIRSDMRKSINRTLLIPFSLFLINFIQSICNSFILQIMSKIIFKLFLCFAFNM